MNTDDLTERIARALARQDGYDPDDHCDEWIMYGMRESAAAVLPIVEAEVRKAKAEALREAAENVDVGELSDAWTRGATTRLSVTNAVTEVLMSLRNRATEYETGDQA